MSSWSSPFNIYCAIWNSVTSLVYYAQNFEEVEGAYWFGPVCATACPVRFAYGQERSETEYLKFNI